MPAKSQRAGVRAKKPQRRRSNSRRPRPRSLKPRPVRSNAPPEQSALWPARFEGLSGERAASILEAVIRHTGRAIASGRFEETTPRAKKAPALHLALASVIASAQVTRAIGALDLADGADTVAWIEHDIATRRLRIWFRGALIPGSRVTREHGVRGRVLRVEKTTGAGVRTFSMEALNEAAGHARNALEAAGVRLSGFSEVRRCRVEGFDGGVAVIGLARAPVKASVLVR